MSCTGLLELLRTGPNDSNSGTSASCCKYADCVSAAVGGGGDAEVFFEEAGTPIVSKVVGLATSWAACARLILGTDEASKGFVEAEGSLTYVTNLDSKAASEKNDSSLTYAAARGSSLKVLR